jgi:CubicO group peptidase (beta-lactamase class C family)
LKTGSSSIAPDGRLYTAQVLKAATRPISRSGARKNSPIPSHASPSAKSAQPTCRNCPFHFEPRASYRICRPAPEPGPALKALEDHAREEEKNDEFYGVYLIARRWQGACAKTFGWENRGSQAQGHAGVQIPHRLVNKMFTAIATLQLVAAKKLSLDGTVGTICRTIRTKTSR